jgi:hypothetical protein
MAIQSVTGFQIAIYKNGVLLADSFVPTYAATSGTAFDVGGALSVADTANGSDYYEAFMFITVPYTQLEGEVSTTGSSFSGVAF